MGIYHADYYVNRVNTNDSQQALQQSLKLIAEAVQGEREDELFYDYLISLAPTQEEKDILASIRNDEIKHNKMFRQMYKEITGEEITSTDGEEFVPPASYIDGIKRALFGELRAVEKYRDIRKGLPTRYHRDIVFEILTDELKHASKYNFLFTLNSTHAQTLPQNREKVSIPDQWLSYIQPLVERALSEVEQQMNLKYVFQEFILSGVLVGRGYSPDQAIEQVGQWERDDSMFLQQSEASKS